MGPQKRVETADSSPSARDENYGHIDGPRTSQGSVDHIVQDMAEVLKESVIRYRYFVVPAPAHTLRRPKSGDVLEEPR